MLSKNIRHFYLYYACFMLLAFSPVHSKAQTISGQLKQADCHFEIYYGDQKLNVIKQMITKRAVHYQITDVAYAHETYFLEWIYENDIEIKDDYDNQAYFFTTTDQKIHSIYIGNYDGVSHEYQRIKNQPPKNNDSERHYYGISLEEVPVFVLDDTYKIVITK